MEGGLFWEKRGLNRIRRGEERRLGMINMVKIFYICVRNKHSETQCLI